MAYKTHFPLLLLFFILNILLALTGEASAGRKVPTNKSKESHNLKHPEFLVDSGGSMLIPGIGRVMLPPKIINSHWPQYNPYTGSIGVPNTATHNFVLAGGGDDTFFPDSPVVAPNPSYG